MRTLALLGSALVLALAGCGGGDDEESGEKRDASGPPKAAADIRACFEQRGDSVSELTNTVPESVTEQMAVNIGDGEQSYLVYVFPDAESAQDELDAVEEGRVNPAADVEVVNNTTVIYRDDGALEEARDCIE